MVSVNISLGNILSLARSAFYHELECERACGWGLQDDIWERLYGNRRTVDPIKVQEVTSRAKLIMLVKLESVYREETGDSQCRHKNWLSSSSSCYRSFSCQLMKTFNPNCFWKRLLCDIADIIIEFTMKYESREICQSIFVRINNVWLLGQLKYLVIDLGNCHPYAVTYPDLYLNLERNSNEPLWLIFFGSETRVALVTGITRKTCMKNGGCRVAVFPQALEVFCECKVVMQK